MLVGGSSGCALAAAIKVIKELNIGEGKRVVVLMPDSVRNYITKFLNNDWMYENGFITEEECIDLTYSKLVPNADWGQEYTIKDLHLTEAVFLRADMSVKDAIDEVQKHSFDQFPVKSAEGKIIGMLTSTMLTTKLIKRKVTLEDPISKCVIKEFRNVSITTPLHELGRVFGRHNYVFVDQQYICSHFDLLNFIKQKQ
jgi:cystathionine beta-synthase